jgi:hypothetical protein
MFDGVKKSVFRSPGVAGVYYYYPESTPEALTEKVANTSFFKEEHWNPFAEPRPSVFISNRMNVSQADATSTNAVMRTIAIYPGKVDEVTAERIPASGATIFLSGVTSP